MAITSYFKSPIAKKADVVLLTSVIESPLAGGGAFRSRIAQWSDFPSTSAADRSSAFHWVAPL